MGASSTQLSILAMISVTLFLMFMDIKDIYYKINMCGPYPTFSFLLTTPEVVTDYDVTQAIQKANGTWISPINMWNELAMQCDALYPSNIPTKARTYRHLGSTVRLEASDAKESTCLLGCTEPLLWATGLFAEIIDEPIPVPPHSNSEYAVRFNLPERAYRLQLAAMVAPEDVSSLNATIHHVYETYGKHTTIWGKSLCYEMMPMPPRGQTTKDIAAVEHGCIWRDMVSGRSVNMHIDAVSGKYYRALSEIMGLQWHTWDYLTPGHGIFLRARLFMIRIMISSTRLTASDCSFKRCNRISASTACSTSCS